MQVEDPAAKDEAPAQPKKIGKAGGAYIPPFRLAQMMQESESKTDASYQRLTWDALRKSINGLVNKANAVNIRPILKELLSEVMPLIAAQQLTFILASSGLPVACNQAPKSWNLG